MTVYKAKADREGMLAIIKARLVLLGNQQKKLQMLTRADSYSPVMKMITFRIFLCRYCGDPRVDFWQLDVECAYLTAPTRHETFINFPNRLRPKGDPPGSVYKLLKALYGGADSGRCFYDDYLEFHLQLGFKMIPNEPCYLIYKCADGTFVAICFYVDDAAYAQFGTALWKWYLKRLATKYKFTLGALEHFLGLRIRRMVNGDFHIDLEAQVARMLRTFHLDKASTKKVPTHDYRPTPEDRPISAKAIAAASRFPMMAAVGHLNYLQQMLEWSITYPLKVASKSVRDGAHGNAHHDWVKQVMLYLASNAWSRYVVYAQPADELILKVWSDADHIKSVDDRRSLSGYLIMLGKTVIAWGASYQTIASHSSMESELMALDTSVRKLVGIIWLVEAMDCPKQPAVHILVDCDSAILSAQNPIPSSRSSHIHMRYFYVQQLHVEGIIELEKVSTDDQLADILVTYKNKSNFDHLMLLTRGYDGRRVISHVQPQLPESWVERSPHTSGGSTSGGQPPTASPSSPPLTPTMPASLALPLTLPMPASLALPLPKKLPVKPAKEIPDKPANEIPVKPAKAVTFS